MPGPWDKYAQQPSEEGPWSKYAQTDAPPADTAPPDTRNGLQKAFDSVANVSPEEDAKHSAPVNALSHFGAGALQTFSPRVHPIQTVEGIGNAIAHPIDTGKQILQHAMEDPAEAAGNLVGGLVTGGAGAEAGEGLLAKLPS